MNAEEEASIIMRVIEYGLKHSSFTLEQLRNALTLTSNEEVNYLNEILAAKSREPNPNNILGVTDVKLEATTGNVRVDTQKSRYSLLPTAYFSYLDHEEIILARENAEAARKNAKEAHEQSIIANRQSLRAIRISMWALILSAIIGIIQIILAMMQYNKS